MSLIRSSSSHINRFSFFLCVLKSYFDLYLKSKHILHFSLNDLDQKKKTIANDYERLFKYNFFLFLQLLNHWTLTNFEHCFIIFMILEVKKIKYPLFDFKNLSKINRYSIFLLFHN